MSHRYRKWVPCLALLVVVALLLSCSLPGRLLERVPEALPSLLPSGGEETEEPTPREAPGEGPTAVTQVVTHQGSDFQVYSLDGTLMASMPAAGLDYARPNTAQVVGDSIYYVDSGGSGLGGVVRRITAEGAQMLDFTAAEPMTSITFAVSADESQIAWTHSSYEATGVVSELWLAAIDGADARLILASDPADEIEEYFALETVGWQGGDLIYAWQVTGIGGYILFFGWSSLYRYSPADGDSTPLIAANAEGSGPCWYAVSPNGRYAIGGCGAEGMLERDLTLGTDTVFPILPDQGQQGAAAYSPSGDRLAFAIARGNPENESGQVLVRLNQGEDPIVLSTQTPGYLERILWADEERMAVGVFDGANSSVDLLTAEGARTPIGAGRLIGLMQSAAPAAAAAAPGLAEQVDRGELEVVRIYSNGEIAGPGMRVLLRNPGPQDVTATIPCGFYFEPDDAGDQRLMVVQEASVVVPAGGEAELTAYVVCIDATSSTPDDGATYRLGSMQNGDLLKLAQCACGEDLSGAEDFAQGMGIMITGWTISEGLTFEEMQSEAGEGAMGDAFSEGMGELFGLLGGLSGDWFEKCGIPRP
jgi:hypothetical protein